MGALGQTSIKVHQPLHKAIYDAYTMAEEACVEALLPYQTITLEQKKHIRKLITAQLDKIKHHRPNDNTLAQLFEQYRLDTEEGVALMCLAEAFIRIPDTETAEALIEDISQRGQWQLKQHNNLLKNASSLGLMLTGKVFKTAPDKQTNVFKQALRKMSGPIALNLINQAINALGSQFIYASDIDSACKKAQQDTQVSHISFDLLGEAAQTTQQAKAYQDAYFQALPRLRQHFHHQLNTPSHENSSQIGMPSLSIKLSSFTPRFDPHQKGALKKLTSVVTDLAICARDNGVRLVIDAEESHHLEPTLHLFKTLYSLPELKSWPEVGLAVQSYQTRALPTLKWLTTLAKEKHARIPIRLVKGAYWDAEIKAAQQYGLSHYPVFTHKEHTDLSYLCCGQYLLMHPNQFSPLFASHNLHTLTSLAFKARELKHRHLGFQRLHGMGDTIFAQLHEDFPDIPQSLYAPVGDQQALLPYLIRRLLENGANTSFLNRFHCPETPIEDLLSDPEMVATPKIIAKKNPGPDQHIPRPSIPRPSMALDASRKQSSAINLYNESVLTQCLQQLQPLYEKFHAGNDQDQLVRNPATLKAIGSHHMTSAQDITQAINTAHHFFHHHWKYTTPEERAQLLEKVALIIEAEKLELLSLLIREGGKTLVNAQQEIREAIDFCRYYAAESTRLQSAPHSLPSYTGELNELSHRPYGVFVCISPWNFPLAILVGQVTAALAAGNCVIAKPATLGELTARCVEKIFIKAGFPEGSVAFTPCPSRIFATVALNHPKIAGVCFTGSTASGHQINHQLAERTGPFIQFIAETGGANAMVVDSTALIEQVTQDILTSAFDSAGQRCSALRILLVQEEIAQPMIDNLIGAMATLTVGNPEDPETDVGPVISIKAKERLQAHINKCETHPLAHTLYQTPLAETLTPGHFIPPTLIDIQSFDVVKDEVFGPVLHVMRYDKKDLPKRLKELNKLGFGLTLGIHTRIQQKAEQIANAIDAGNTYINRNMIGAIVGAQPFGGIQLSGTGSKSGGPYTLLNFTYQKTVARNLTAIGGNVTLLTHTDKNKPDVQNTT